MSATEKTLSAAAAAVSADVQAELLGEDGKIKATVNDKGVASMETSNDPYVKHLDRSGFTVQHVTDVKNADRTFVAGTMDALSKATMKLVADGTKVEKATLAVPGVKGETFDVAWQGVDSGTMKGKEGQPDINWKSYGGLSVRHRQVTKAKGGDIGTAMALSAAAAEALLGKAE